MDGIDWGTAPAWAAIVVSSLALLFAGAAWRRERGRDKARQYAELQAKLDAGAAQWLPAPVVPTNRLTAIAGPDALPRSVTQRFLDGARNAGGTSLNLLQLFNSVIEDLPVRICANETCRRRFQRQRGRGKHGGTQRHTRGVRYCSVQCSNAQAARDRRARLRGEQA